MWIISSALLAAYENSRCSPEQAAEYLADTCSDGEPSAPLSGPHILRLYLPQDKMTDFSRPSRFGVMCKPLTANHGADVLMWYREGFPVRTLAQPGRVQESTANAPACGRTWQGLLARYNPFLSTWKTPQCSLLEDSDVFSETWPRSGTMRNGCAYQRQSAERITSGTGYGYWPTPTVCGNYNRKGASKTSGDGLATAVRMWPTPVASMSKGSSPAALIRKNGRDRSNDRLDHAVMASDSGQLNPMWVEWLMGWPLGLTDLRPLETDKFREWQQQHSLSFTGG